jgi:uncharacterized protein with HEPN domain
LPGTEIGTEIQNGTEIQKTESEIEWRKIVALRNLLIHEYFGISREIVWDIVKNKLDTLEKFCLTATKE